ncbi:tRNA CCA-pyrophosphorylase [Buchnera aphidicola (Chaitoregma tattakana)]|uniref:tRNA CCA-pyrophosphorylase n=1 Tax=Buchnera aphidicola TaxID=9 RepID=UPI0031B8741D
MRKYLVGGAVRNKILGLPVKDKDWVVVGSTPDFFIKNKYKQVGKKFPVFLHPITNEEYALARTEKKCGVGYKGFEVNYSPYIKLKEDLIRRDITINAIAQDKFGKYFDPCNGLLDIKKRLLRHISPSFSDDPLRVFRVARFAALLFHLGFKICSNTLSLMSSKFLKNEIKHLEIERIWQETEKAFRTKNPNIYLQVLFDCNLISTIFPEIYYLFGLNNKFNYFNKKKFYKQNIFQGLSYISKYTNRVDIKFSFFLQLFNINLICCVTNKRKNYFFKHFLKYIYNFLNRIKAPKKVKNLSLVFIKNINLLINISNISSTEIVILLKKMNAWRNPKIIKKISLLMNCYINFLNIFSKKNKHKGIFYSQYLKNVFKVASTVSFSSISVEIKNGMYIQKELDRLKKLAIDRWKTFNTVNCFKNC